MTDFLSANDERKHREAYAAASKRISMQGRRTSRMQSLLRKDERLPIAVNDDAHRSATYSKREDPVIDQARIRRVHGAVPGFYLSIRQDGKNAFAESKIYFLEISGFFGI